MHAQSGDRDAHGAPQTRGSVIRWARLYDIATNVLTFGKETTLRRSIIELAAIRSGEKILDVGCGTGTLALLAKQRGGADVEVHGIDASPEMIEVAEKKAGQTLLTGGKGLQFCLEGFHDIAGSKPVIALNGAHGGYGGKVSLMADFYHARKKGVKGFVTAGRHLQHVIVELSSEHSGCASCATRYAAHRGCPSPSAASSVSAQEGWWIRRLLIG